MHTEKNQRPLISAIVPFYNEQDTLEEVLERLKNVGKRLPLEIVAVDDGSTDASREVAKRVGDVKLVCHKKNCGKGKAIATGLSHSNGRVIVIQDADCEYPPEEIPKLVEPIAKGEADAVFGSRFLAKNSGMSLSHRLGNSVLSLVTSVLYNVRVTDVMTGHKCFSRQAIEHIGLVEKGFGIEVELTGKLLANRSVLKEVPIVYVKRTHGDSKISYRDGVLSLVKIFCVRFKGTTTSQDSGR